MRGAGVTRFENDFPPGSDMVREIMSGPQAAERMEFVVFGRRAVDENYVSQGLPLPDAMSVSTGRSFSLLKR